MAQSYPSIGHSARRRSQRVLMQLAVTIRGADADGENFQEETETLAISAHGCLVLLRRKVVSGASVILKNHRTEEEQECHVVFLGPNRAGRAEVGIEFTEPRPSFWRVAFPPEDWTPKHPEARTIAQTRHEK
ncbi:MAG TPA: PilZ domain-containing protein [Methylomirabilota bacterium]|jgi:hypothetical protein|nr:PilZ domain-containing protein [Methylomirabilota bacterium]